MIETTTFHTSTGTSPLSPMVPRGSSPAKAPMPEKLVFRVGPTVPARTSLTVPLTRRYMTSSSASSSASLDAQQPAPDVRVHVPHSAAPEPQPPVELPGACRTVCQSLLLTAGVFLKTVGGVYPARQLGGAISSGLMKMHVAFMPEDDPVAEAMYSVLVMAAYTVAIAYVCGKFISPMTSAFLTHMEKDSHGKEQVARRGGCCHHAISVGLAELPLIATLGKALIDGMDKPEGAERNLVVMACLAGAIKTLMYGASRGLFERVGAKLIPTRTIVDAKGTPVPANEVKQLNPRRALYQYPATLLANIWVISSILEVPFDDDPLAQMTGATGAYISVYIGLYEAMVAFADIAATAASAHHQGWSMALGLKPPVEAPQPQSEAAATIPEHLKPRAQAVVDSVELDRCMSRLKGLFKRPVPDVYVIVTALRNFINMHLSLTLDAHVVGALDPGRFPAVTIAAHALVLGMAELSPILLEGGLAAQASEGKGDREMFDKLHLLFKLQDLIYLQMHGTAHPESAHPIIRRKLDPAICGLIEENTTFDDVREHLAALNRSRQPRRAAADPVTDFVLYEPKYPTKAMKQKFGHVLSGEAALPGSRIKSAIDQFIDELVNELEAEKEIPPPPPIDLLDPSAAPVV